MPSSSRVVVVASATDWNPWGEGGGGARADVGTGGTTASPHKAPGGSVWETTRCHSTPAAFNRNSHRRPRSQHVRAGTPVVSPTVAAMPAAISQMASVSGGAADGYRGLLGPRRGVSRFSSLAGLVHESYGMVRLWGWVAGPASAARRSRVCGYMPAVGGTVHNRRAAHLPHTRTLTPHPIRSSSHLLCLFFAACSVCSVVGVSSVSVSGA